jgi:photosynthetic reaction center cytochrome c subunit
MMAGFEPETDRFGMERNSMTGKNQAAVLTVLGLLVVCGLAINGAKGQSGSAPATTKAPKMAEEQFKNIQVLKGVPADQLIPAMQFITASLGVECEFCHVEGAFEKDDKKPKQTARKMMEMMFAINRDNFDGHREVTCYSCHRGSTDPVATPAVMADEPKEIVMSARAETPEAKEAAGPTPVQLFDKYVQAAGGAAAIKKITSRVEKGTIEFGGKSFPIDVYSKDPGKRVSFTHMPEGDNVTAFNGREGWLSAPGRPVRDMHGPDLDGAAIDADLHFPLDLKHQFTEVRSGQPEKVGDREAYVVVGQRESKPPLRLYFDEQTGLLLRLVRYGETPLGRLPTQIDYADYRDIAGVKIPFRWTLARATGRFTIQISDVKANVPVDDAKFAKPPEPPPAK